MKKFLRWLFLAGVILCFTACGEAKTLNTEAKEMMIYYINREDTKLVTETFPVDDGGTEFIVQALLERLEAQPESLELKPILEDNVVIKNWKVEEKQVILNFESSYTKLEKTKEILVRAAVVRTLTQLPEVEYVSFQLNGKPLKDFMGNPIGTMTRDSFIDNAGTETNSYEKVKLKLYFANESGDKLVAVNRTLVYNSNVSLEKLVVEQLIEGPSNKETYPTLNKDTKIVSITTKDGVCYVNLNEAFLKQIPEVSTEVMIYSITNSLVELSNVNKVQILINGDSDTTFREKKLLKTIFERNLEIVAQ